MPFEKRKIIDFNIPSLLSAYAAYISFLKTEVKDNYVDSQNDKDATRNFRCSQDRAAIWLNDYNMNQERSITNEETNKNQESIITNEARKTFFDELKNSDSNARKDIIRIQAQGFTSFLTAKFPKKIGEHIFNFHSASDQQAYYIFKDNQGYTHFEINSLTKITLLGCVYMGEGIEPFSYYLDNNGDLKKYKLNHGPKPEIGAYPFDMCQHLDLKFCWQKKDDLVSKIENILGNNTEYKSDNINKYTSCQGDIEYLNEFINFLSGTDKGHSYHLQTRSVGDEEEVFFPEIDLKQSLSYDKYKPETEYLDLSIGPNGTEFNEIKFYKSIVTTLSNILDKCGVEEKVVEKIKKNVVRQIKDLFLLNMKRDLEKNYYSSDIDYLNQMDEVIKQIEDLVKHHDIHGLDFDINDMKYCIDAAFLPNDSDTPAARNRKLSYLRKSVIDENISPNRASFQAALNVRQDYKDAKTNTNIIKYTTLFLSTLFFILAFLPLMTPLGPAGVIATATIFSLATVATLSIGFKAYSQREQLLQGPQARWNFIKATRSDEFARGSYKAIPQASFGGIIPNKGLKMD